MNSYYKDTPQERKKRRHEEDKIENPHRHLLTKDFYTHSEGMDFCPLCADEQLKNYIYDYRTMTLIRMES